jgi:hypothetical protein
VQFFGNFDVIDDCSVLLQYGRGIEGMLAYVFEIGASSAYLVWGRPIRCNLECVIFDDENKTAAGMKCRV